MKYLLLFLMVLSLLSCSEKPYKANTRIEVVEIDSCEYIFCGGNTSVGYAICHKHNCKYCKQRNK